MTGRGNLRWPLWATWHAIGTVTSPFRVLSIGIVDSEGGGIGPTLLRGGGCGRDMAGKDMLR
jgi:hypothetical protein